MELAQLKAFMAVARAGGFAAAADACDVAPSSVTRAVAALERSLGVRLFQRTTRKVSLTEEGERLLARVGPALEELDAAREDVTGGACDISGRLRVSTSVSYGQLRIAPHLREFCDRHPHLSIDLILSDATLDLVSERIDVAVRHGALKDSSLIAQRLQTVRYHLVASGDYLETAPTLDEPGDLAGHRCLTFPYPAFQTHWRFQRNGDTRDIAIQARLTLSNAAALLDCARRGMGVALLADWMVDEHIASGALTALLPSWRANGTHEEADSALWIVMPSRQFIPAKTVAFSEFLRETRHPN